MESKMFSYITIKMNSCPVILFSILPIVNRSAVLHSQSLDAEKLRSSAHRAVGSGK